MAKRKSKKAKRTFELELSLDGAGDIDIVGPRDALGYVEGMSMCREGWIAVTGFVPPEPASDPRPVRWRAKVTMELERIR